MRRDYKVYLEDILEAIGRIRKYTSGVTAEALGSDTKTLDAILRNLEVIGEAAKKIPETVRAQNPQIEWRKIAGLRDIIIHEYFNVDTEISWDITQNKLPIFEKQIREIFS